MGPLLNIPQAEKSKVEARCLENSCRGLPLQGLPIIAILAERVSYVDPIGVESEGRKSKAYG
jgi:hypothetical protein